MIQHTNSISNYIIVKLRFFTYTSFMEQNSTSARFHALDGIRGLAILLVVLNHVNSGYISSVMPSWLDQIIFDSGVTGVSLLFVLSGFLMTYIYPNPQSGLHFLQKRYTR